MMKQTKVLLVVSSLVLMLSPLPSYGGQQEFEIQACLKARGFDPGPLDGLPGKKTAAAISAYQESRGIPDSSPLPEQGVEILCDGVDISKFQMVRKSTEFNRTRTSGGETLSVSLWQGEPPGDAPGSKVFVFGSGGLTARSTAPGVHVSGRVTIKRGDALRTDSFPNVLDRHGNELGLTMSFNSISGEFDVYVPPEYASQVLLFSVESFDTVEFRPASLPKKGANH